MIRREYDIRVGSYLDSEIDFIAKRRRMVEYYQVCQTILAEGAAKREMAPFSKTKDNRSKTILTLDRFGLGDHEGVLIANLVDWLMESEL